MVLAFIGGVFVGVIIGVFLIALCIGAHNSNYSVEELRREEAPEDETE